MNGSMLFSLRSYLYGYPILFRVNDWIRCLVYLDRCACCPDFLDRYHSPSKMEPFIAFLLDSVILGSSAGMDIRDVADAVQTGGGNHRFSPTREWSRILDGQQSHKR